jgi:hypothetical protein
MQQCMMEEPGLETKLSADPPGEPASLYYGWVMLPMSIAALIASSPGQTFGVSVFNEPMRLSLVFLFPAVVLLFRNHPADVGQRIGGETPSGGEAVASRAAVESHWGLTLGQTLRNGAFWIVTGGTALFGLIHTAVFFCLVPILQERGLSAGDATATRTTFAGFLAVAQLPAGMLADRVQARLLLLAGMACFAIPARWRSRQARSSVGSDSASRSERPWRMPASANLRWSSDSLP